MNAPQTELGMNVVDVVVLVATVVVVVDGAATDVLVVVEVVVEVLEVVEVDGAVVVGVPVFATHVHPPVQCWPGPHPS
jgi:hypothetical protein